MFIWSVTAVDFFFISAGLTIWIFLLGWVFVFFKISRLIREAELEIKSVKNTLKLTGLNLISKIIRKGGENSGK